MFTKVTSRLTRAASPYDARLRLADGCSSRTIARMGNVQAVVGLSAVGGALGAVLSRPARRLARDPRPSVLRPGFLAMATAALFAVAIWRVPDPVAVAVAAAVALAGVPLAALDLAERRLPTPLVGLLAAAVLVVILIDALRHGDAAPALRAAAGMTTAVVFYLAVALAIGPLGAGDVRLAGALGLALAWHSWPTLIYGNLLGLALAAIAGLAIMALRHHGRHTQLPLGPALIAGALIALLTTP